MVKKLMILVLITLISFMEVFAQTDDFEAMPKNAITVDFGPIIIGVTIGIAGSILTEDVEGVNVSGFGIATQYERQLLKQLSVAGRFAYLGANLGFSEEEGGDKAVLEMELSSFSLESHVRYYPFGETFFLDGMLGFANMSADFSGEIITTNEETNKKDVEKIAADLSRGYFKYGVKLGWRVDFGKPGGFVFEPAFGYYWGSGAGDTFGKQLKDYAVKHYDEGDDIDIKDIDDAFSIIEQFIFIGGPRMTLSFGWRF